MKPSIGILVCRLASVAIVGCVANPIYASCAPQRDASHRQGFTIASDVPQPLAQEGSFRERLREREEAKMDELSAQLQKNPNLIDDPKFLEQHPMLADYVANHPGAKEKIKKDPKAFFEHLKEERRRAAG